MKVLFVLILSSVYRHNSWPSWTCCFWTRQRGNLWFWIESELCSKRAVHVRDGDSQDNQGAQACVFESPLFGIAQTQIPFCQMAGRARWNSTNWTGSRCSFSGVWLFEWFEFVLNYYSSRNSIRKLFLSKGRAKFLRIIYTFLVIILFFEFWCEKNAF